MGKTPLLAAFGAKKKANPRQTLVPPVGPKPPPGIGPSSQKQNKAGPSNLFGKLDNTSKIQKKSTGALWLKKTFAPERRSTKLFHTNQGNIGKELSKKQT